MGKHRSAKDWGAAQDGMWKSRPWTFTVSTLALGNHQYTITLFKFTGFLIFITNNKIFFFLTSKKASESQFSLETSTVLLLTDKAYSLLCSFFAIIHFCLGLCLWASMEINANLHYLTIHPPVLLIIIFIKYVSVVMKIIFLDYYINESL